MKILGIIIAVVGLFISGAFGSKSIRYQNVPKDLPKEEKKKIIKEKLMGWLWSFVGIAIMLVGVVIFTNNK